MLIEISFVPLLSDAITVKGPGTHGLPWPLKLAQMACTTDLEGGHNYWPTENKWGNFTRITNEATVAELCALSPFPSVLPPLPSFSFLLGV